jgi:hypothetical protein
MSACRGANQRRVTVTSGGNDSGSFWKIVEFKWLERPFVWLVSTFPDLPRFVISIESSAAKTKIASPSLAGVSSTIRASPRRRVAICFPLTYLYVASLLVRATPHFAAMRLTLRLDLAMQILACGCDRVNTSRGFTLLLILELVRGDVTDGMRLLFLSRRRISR